MQMPVAVEIRPAHDLALTVSWDGGPLAEVSLPDGRPLERWRMHNDTGRPLVPLEAASLREVAAYRLERVPGLDRLLRDARRKQLATQGRINHHAPASA